MHPGEEPHETGRQQRAETQSRDAENAQLRGQPSHVCQVGGTRGGHAGQQGQQNDCGKVFHQQDADHRLAPSGAQIAAVPQSLEQYRRAADGHGAAQIQGVRPGYAQHFVGDQHTQVGQGGDLHYPDNQHAQADFLDASPAQFQADAEEQEDQPQLGQQLDGVQVADDRVRQGVRPDQQPGNEVTEYGRLPYQPG